MLIVDKDKDTFETEVLKSEETVFVDFFGVMAIYKNGEKVEELVKEEATPEKIEGMIKKYALAPSI